MLNDSPLNISNLLQEEGIEDLPSFDSSNGPPLTSTMRRPLETQLYQLSLSQYLKDENIDLPSFDSVSEPRSYHPKFADVQTSTTSPEPVIKTFNDLADCCNIYDYIPSSSLRLFCLSNQDKVEGFDGMKEQLVNFLTKHQPQMDLSSAPLSRVLSDAIRFILDDLMKTKMKMSNLQKEKNQQAKEIENLNCKVRDMELKPTAVPKQATPERALRSAGELAKMNQVSQIRKAQEPRPQDIPAIPQHRQPVSSGLTAPRQLTGLQRPTLATPRQIPGSSRQTTAAPRQTSGISSQAPGVARQMPTVPRQIPGPARPVSKSQKEHLPVKAFQKGSPLASPGNKGATQKTIALSSPSGKEPVLVDVKIDTRPLKFNAGPSQTYSRSRTSAPQMKTNLPQSGRLAHGRPTARIQPQSTMNLSSRR